MGKNYPTLFKTNDEARQEVIRQAEEIRKQYMAAAVEHLRERIEAEIKPCILRHADLVNQMSAEELRQAKGRFASLKDQAPQLIDRFLGKCAAWWSVPADQRERTKSSATEYELLNTGFRKALGCMVLELKPFRFGFNAEMIDDVPAIGGTVQESKRMGELREQYKALNQQLSKLQNEYSALESEQKREQALNRWEST